MLNYLAEEQLCAFVLRIIEEFIGLVLFDNLTRIHENNPIRNLLGETHFVGDTEHCHAFFGEFDHDVEHFMTLGLMHRQRAIATRCCCPPES